MSKTALIVGASGLTGSHCLHFLLKNDTYGQVISLGRKKLQVNHPKLVQIISDFSNLNAVFADIQVDDVFSCLGTTIKKAGSKEAFLNVDYEYPLTIAKLAKSHGTHGFHIVSALGANASSAIFYSKVKGMLEAEILKLDFDNVNILRPSILDGDRKENRIGEKIGLSVLKFLSPVLIGPLKKLRPTKAEAVGFVMVEMATNGIKGFSIIEPEQIAQIYRKHKK
jgi:uncharacterized protein YbjT (DUF2867 family)